MRQIILLNVLSFVMLSLAAQNSSCPPIVTDYDGNTYNTVKIGNQCWMKENLRTTHYADGVVIPNGGTTVAEDDPFWYYPGNSSSNATQYGLLYNSNAVTRGHWGEEPRGVQGVCPKGWHVPSNVEWEELVVFLENAHAANAMGFSPRRAGEGSSEFGESAYFWTATCTSNYPPSYSYSFEEAKFIYTDNHHIMAGLSVRCVYGLGTSVDVVLGQMSQTESNKNAGNPNDGKPCPGTATVKDYDGNTYETVQIGQQCWMKENLHTTHYADGSIIAQGGETKSQTKAYWNYNGIDDLVYNWAAVMHGADPTSKNPSGVQGICPSGWHVPSDAEWSQLINYVDSQEKYKSGDNSVGKALSDQWSWYKESSEYRTVGNKPSSNNATGFSATSLNGERSFYHSTTIDEDGEITAGFQIWYHESYPGSPLFWNISEYGYVRCVRDQKVVTKMLSPAM